jgi:hypothetical protein
MVLQLRSTIAPEGFRILGWEDSAQPSMEIEPWQ